MSILDTIVARKKEEIARLYAEHDLASLQADTLPTSKNLYAKVAERRAAGAHFWITEFKRKSPSEGWIHEHADVRAQVRQYAEVEANAVSVLTDTPFFGGSYADLKAASEVLADTPVLLLQKDFVLDPIQIYLARRHGADMILLIAAILEPEQLEALRLCAQSLGMGALVEVHDQEELDKIQHLDFPLLGVNNRDLKTFRTALNRVNVLRRQARGRYLISESGIHLYSDFLAVRRSDGFLIGTSLMRQTSDGAGERVALPEAARRRIVKACGLRTTNLIKAETADLIGINFSPRSKRRVAPEVLDSVAVPPNAVAVFYQNDEDEIRAVLQHYGFKMAQLYAGDVRPGFVKSLKCKVILAVQVRTEADLDQVEDYAADVDFFILDGATPGSGQRIDATIPADFPYPFLLAGGIHAENAHLAAACSNCIGVDVASGIETDGVVDAAKIEAIRQAVPAM